MSDVHQPKVMVLLAAYNGSRWIQSQIQSIQAQLDVDVHLVVCDDGSTDDTLASVEKMTSDRLTLVTTAPQPTGSAAQNFFNMIRETSAEGYGFISFSDQDDIWEPLKLIRACSLLQERQAAGYSSAVTAFWDNGRQAELSQVNKLTRSDFFFEGAGQGCTFVLTADFYARLRRFLIQNASSFNDIHYHDWSIYALARTWGMAWVFDKKPMMKYRQHGSNDTGARASIHGIVKRVRKIQDGWYLLQLRAIANLCYLAAPASELVAEWRTILGLSPGFGRKIRIISFCWRGGRRRLADRAVLLAAAVAGWI